MINSKPKKNIVLDLDGTLLDSRRRHAAVLSDCINQINGIASTYTNFDDFVPYKTEGNTGLAYLKNKGIANAKGIFSLWKKKIEEKKYLEIDTLYPNVRESLEILKEQYNLFLITARANTENTMWQLSQLYIDTFFTGIFVVPNTGNVGDNKYVAVKSLPITYVIGDTETDYDLAKRVDSVFFPLNCGFRSATFWQQHIGKSYGNIHEILPQITTIL